MQAVVLVGGEGTRLRPLTEAMPKAVVPLAGRPFISYLIEWLGSHGVEEVALACGFLPGGLRGVLGEGEPGGPRLRYLTEPEPLGTGGAIRFAAEALGDRFLALNGDVLTNLDLTALIRAHQARGAKATVGLHQVGDASAYGLVRTGPDGDVLEFTEKPEAGGGPINAGIYVLERAVLDLIPAGRKVSIEREVFPRLVGAGLFGLRLDGYWTDIGTPGRYLGATWDILEGRVGAAAGARPDGLLLDPAASVAPTASVGPRAVISAGCRIGAGASVQESVLLADCTVGEGAGVRRSILAPEAIVEPGARLDRAVVAAGERVGAR